MRIAFVVPLLLLGACNVSKEGNAVTVQYDQNTAENTAADIGNDVKKTGDKIENKVGNTDVSVKVDHDEHTNTTTKTEHKSK